MTLPVERINRSFVESGIEIQEVHLCEDTLEDYFKKITGGEGIA
jgi:bacitracin transport system ATP-binding protein